MLLTKMFDVRDGHMSFWKNSTHSLPFLQKTKQSITKNKQTSILNEGNPLSLSPKVTEIENACQSKLELYTRKLHQYSLLVLTLPCC